MPKIHTRRHSRSTRRHSRSTRRHSRSTRRHSRSARRQYRKQRGGDLVADLVAKRDAAEEFTGFMANQGKYVAIHPNFPRKNAADKYVLIYKDVELEDDAAPQRLLAITMDKQGGEFVNITVEHLQDGMPQTFMDAYPVEIGGANANSAAISAAIGAAFPGMGLAY